MIERIATWFKNVISSSVEVEVLCSADQTSWRIREPHISLTLTHFKGEGWQLYEDPQPYCFAGESPALMLMKWSDLMIEQTESERLRIARRVKLRLTAQIHRYGAVDWEGNLIGGGLRHDGTCVAGLRQIGILPDA